MLNRDICLNGQQYGYVTYDKNSKAYFCPLGVAPNLREVFSSLETGKMTLKLSHQCLGEEKIAMLDLGSLHDGSGIKELAAKGFSSRKGYSEAFIEAIWLLFDDYSLTGNVPTVSYENLGWYHQRRPNPYSGELEIYEVFRCCKLLGYQGNAKYLGCYDIQPSGYLETWKQMVINDVIPYPALQLVLVAALSSVVIGLLALRRQVSCPIVHLNLPSGRGKSTAGMLAVSTVGASSNAPIPRVDEDGQVTRRHSLFQSWAATDTALLASQANNYGAVVVLNELGKCLSKNLDSVVFNLSDGSDKKRMTASMKARVTDGYATTFISNGECSLLEKCNTKLEGLAVRVLEIDDALTVDADHANRITDVCKWNYGFASPMLAKHILRHGGFGFVNQRYEELRIGLREHFPQTPSVERFIEIFVAPFMLTAELATEALGIPFDVDGLLKFLVDHENAKGTDRATSDTSYGQLLEEFSINADKFICRSNLEGAHAFTQEENRSFPSRTVWGRITDKETLHEDGRYIVREYEVFPAVVENLLKKHGYTNRSTCIAAWKKMGVLDFEDATHHTRKRKICSDVSGHVDRVFVFREFADDEETQRILEKNKAKEAAKEAKLKKLHKNSMAIDLLKDDE